MAPSHDLLADFVDRFTEFWRAPDPQALSRVLAPDVHLEAPLTPPTDGMDAAMGVFGALVGRYRDLRAEVHRWGPHDDGVFIEFTLLATHDGRPLRIPAVDVFLVDEDGLGTQRISYFDPAPFLAAH